MALLADRLARRSLDDEIGARLVSVAQATAAPPDEVHAVSARDAVVGGGRRALGLATLARAAGRADQGSTQT
jgi:hypothetical protein